MTTDRHKAQQRKWHAEHDEPKGLMGEVPPLAPGAINPMWSISESLPSFARAVAPILRETEPKKKKSTTYNTNSGIFIGQKPKTRGLPEPVKLDDEIDDILEL